MTLALPDGSAAALTPAFSAAVTSYTAKAPHTAEHVTVAASGTSVVISPEDADPAAPGHQVALVPDVLDSPTVTLTGADTATPAFTAPAAAGPLHFRLTVTGRGGDVEFITPTMSREIKYSATDTVTVTVASSTAQMDASLASLTVTHAGAPVALTPSFSPGTDSYRARLANAAARVTVAATAGNAAADGALLDLNSAPLTDADPATADSFEVDLAEGGNIVRVQVTAADGATTRTYVLNLARNTLPTGADRTVTIAEDTQYTFGTTNFGFGDRDAGDALAIVTVATLPGAGRLAFGGSDVGAGDVVARVTSPA